MEGYANARLPRDAQSDCHGIMPLFQVATPGPDRNNVFFFQLWSEIRFSDYNLLG